MKSATRNIIRNIIYVIVVSTFLFGTVSAQFAATTAAADIDTTTTTTTPVPTTSTTTASTTTTRTTTTLAPTTTSTTAATTTTTTTAAPTTTTKAPTTTTTAAPPTSVAESSTTAAGAGQTTSLSDYVCAYGVKGNVSHTVCTGGCFTLLVNSKYSLGCIEDLDVSDHGFSSTRCREEERGGMCLDTGEGDDKQEACLRCCQGQDKCNYLMRTLCDILPEHETCDACSMTASISLILFVSALTRVLQA